MEPKLLGYLPKRPAGRPDWLKVDGIQEIASLSECISSGPDNWIEKWLHNEMWYFDSPEVAWSIIPEEERCEFNMYAYSLYPIIFTNGVQSGFTIPELQVQSLDDSFEFLGYDFVSRYSGSSFECSPLSCNSLAETVSVNSYCLVETYDSAYNLAKSAESNGCEPGPYFIVQVWRQRTVAT